MTPFIARYPWTEYSNLLIERILHPKNVGFFPENAGQLQEMRVVIGTRTEEEAGAYVTFFLVVDETDATIVDAKFRAFGESPLIGAADIVCEIVLRKTYEQVRRLSAAIPERKLRDFHDIPAFPKSADRYLNMVLEALDVAAEQCTDIALPNPETTSPLPLDREEEPETDRVAEWESLSTEEKLALIRNVVEEEVQPYIALDAGGIEVRSLDHDREVVIAYQGACTTCPASTGSTLGAIEKILRARIRPHLIVKPDLSLLHIDPAHLPE
ncbi:MAG: NifU family protein [Simkaniaceae bacterium]|nr:NifU family protein [Simkaniaceae bacterium]